MVEETKVCDKELSVNSSKHVEEKLTVLKFQDAITKFK